VPLPVSSSEPLSIPATEFNEHGLAVIFLSGGRYGGDWAFNATVPGGDRSLGEFETSVDDRRKQALQNDPGYPDRAIETAFIWLTGEVRKHGWRVVGFECLNDQYGPAERPYFCLARAIVADSTFKPSPGVTYADEMTLDAVMGYRTGAER
jgi:hypothetical protein